jgi:hypothetical protein
VTFDNTPGANAVHTSAVPNCVLVRRANVQVNPAPDTVADWPPELVGPSAATIATNNSPAADVENAAVVWVPRPSTNTDLSITNDDPEPDDTAKLCNTDAAALNELFPG